jgi:hypothetical protein
VADSSINVKIGADSKQAVDELKKISSQFNSMKNVAVAVGGAIIAAFAFDKLVDGFKAVVGAAEESEKAVQQLNVALKLSGSFSEAAVGRFKALGDELQRNTTFTDEAVLSSVTLAKQFNATNDQAEKMVRAAADLAAATGTDLNTATKQLAMTLDGTTGKIAEQIPQLRGLTAEQLRAGKAIDVVADRFKGAAQASGNTFSGAIIKAQNAFDDLLETLGEFIIKNPFVIKGINFIAESFRNIKRFIDANRTAILSLVKDGMVFLLDAIDLAISGFKLMDKTINFVVRNAKNILQPFRSESKIAQAEDEQATASLQKRIEFYDKLKTSVSEVAKEIEKTKPAALMQDQDTGLKNGTPAGKAPLTQKEQAEKLKPFSQIVGAIGEGGESGAIGVMSQVIELIPVFGGFLSQLFEFLAQGPDKVREIITSLLESVPHIIENVILAIPSVILAWISHFPRMVNEIIAQFPKIIAAFIAQIPVIISEIIKQLPLVMMNFIATLPMLWIEIIKNIPTIIVAFTQEFMKIPEKFGQAVIDAIKNLFGGLGDFFGGLFAQGGIVGAAGGYGVIQGGYPGKDSVPILAQAGELIVPRSNFNEVIEAVSAARLSNQGQMNFAGGGGGGGGNVNVVISMEGEAAEKVLTARQVEARSLGTLRESSG